MIAVMIPLTEFMVKVSREANAPVVASVNIEEIHEAAKQAVEKQGSRGQWMTESLWQVRTLPVGHEWTVWCMFET